MPDSRIRVHFRDAGTAIEASVDGRPTDPAVLRAPAEPGLTRLRVRNPVNGETAELNVFTLVPASRVGEDHRLNGYRLGAYPGTPLRGLDIYRPPAGFVEVTAANVDTRVSPNFTLGQFVAKQASGYPKYLVLRASLLLKLENILATLNREGHPTGGLVIMSGYRTPFYNQAIGNTRYSRHVWGGAADVYIDERPADGIMDDLDGDGRTTRDDAQWLASFIDGMSRRGVFGPRIGGIGVYGSTAAHGPFVHVDVRDCRVVRHLRKGACRDHADDWIMICTRSIGMGGIRAGDGAPTPRSVSAD